MPAALLSVSDKEGLVEFAQGLASLGFEIIATSGTAKVLRAAGVACTEVSEYTGYPELAGGRVKTLHPLIHAGILAKGGAELEGFGAKRIDLVAVSLYPFAGVVARGAGEEEAVENIDVGGVALLRAAAKNHSRVTVVTNRGQYALVLDELRAAGSVKSETRHALARQAFALTSSYDAAIAGYMGAVSASDELVLRLRKHGELRYGENPHQRAGFYAIQDGPSHFSPAMRQLLGGKQLSYNNILDASRAWATVSEFSAPQCACAIVKHANPCGGAIGTTPREAFERALCTDSLSAFGGIVAFNRPVDEGAADALKQVFLEVIVAPSFTQRALASLSEKKNLRVMQAAPQDSEGALEVRSVAGGVLVQEADRALLSPALNFPTSRKPSESELAALEFAMKFAKHASSNAIALAQPGLLVGIGAGQTSRVDAVGLAVGKAARSGLSTQGACMASDAFFPFRDAVDVAAGAGVTAVMHPGGSVRDAEVINACDEHGIAMAVSGLRHFRH